MAKEFFTERDIEEYLKAGKTTLSVNDDVVLTDLAYEKAGRLGIKIVRDGSASQSSKAFAKPQQMVTVPAATVKDDLPPILAQHVKEASERVIQRASSPGSVPLSQKNYTDIREELLEINNELYAAGMITSTGGNISVRIPGRENEFWITPGSIFKGDLRTDMMVRIDLDGKSLDKDAYPASSERFVHCEIYRRRPDINVVVHTHAPYATVLVLRGLPFLPISIESAFIGEIARVDFMKPGTVDLGVAVAEAMGDSFAALMQNHGLVVAGRSLRSAADMTHVVEQTAKKIVTCYMLGEAPPALDPETAEEYRRMGEMRA